MKSLQSYITKINLFPWRTEVNKWVDLVADRLSARCMDLASLNKYIIWFGFN